MPPMPTHRHFLDALTYALADVRDNVAEKEAILARYKSVEEMGHLVEALAAMFAHSTGKVLETDPTYEKTLEEILEDVIREVASRVEGPARMRLLPPIEGKQGK